MTDGDVCFDAPHEVIVDIKLDGDVTQRHELDLTDFALPVESCRLLAQIDSVRNGGFMKASGRCCGYAGRRSYRVRKRNTLW